MPRVGIWQLLRHHFGHLHPILECMSLSSRSVSDSGFLLMCTLGGMRRWLTYLVPVILGGLD